MIVSSAENDTASCVCVGTCAYVHVRICKYLHALKCYCELYISQISINAQKLFPHASFNYQLHIDIVNICQVVLIFTEVDDFLTRRFLMLYT